MHLKASALVALVHRWLGATRRKNTFLFSSLIVISSSCSRVCKSCAIALNVNNDPGIKSRKICLNQRNSIIELGRERKRDKSMFLVRLWNGKRLIVVEKNPEIRSNAKHSDWRILLMLSFVCFFFQFSFCERERKKMLYQHTQIRFCTVYHRNTRITASYLQRWNLLFGKRRSTIIFCKEAILLHCSSLYTLHIHLCAL